MRSCCPLIIFAALALLSRVQPVSAADGEPSAQASYVTVQRLFDKAGPAAKADIEGYFSGRMFKKQSPGSANGSLLVGYKGKFKKKPAFKALVEHTAVSPSYYDTVDKRVLSGLILTEEKKQSLSPASVAATGLLSIQKNPAGRETVREIRKYGGCLFIKEGKTAAAYAYYCKEVSGMNVAAAKTASKRKTGGKSAPRSRASDDSAPEKASSDSTQGSADGGDDGDDGKGAQAQRLGAFRAGTVRKFSELLPFTEQQRHEAPDDVDADDDDDDDAKPETPCRWRTRKAVAKAYRQAEIVGEEDISGWFSGRNLIGPDIHHSKALDKSKSLNKLEGALIAFQKVALKDGTVIVMPMFYADFDAHSDREDAFDVPDEKLIAMIEERVASEKSAAKAYPDRYNSEFYVHREGRHNGRALGLSGPNGSYLIRKYAGCLIVRYFGPSFFYSVKKVRTVDLNSESAGEEKNK
ncbi:MAG: hypothetical protein PHP45_09440 [Elusimicrobiales bacterium]|nr:hypothetical protein [Elusimicrobiales bacterium]